MFKIRGIIFCDTKVTLYNLQKMIFCNLSNLNSGLFSVFLAFEKYIINFSVKIPRCFTSFCLYSEFVRFLLYVTIMTDSLITLFKVLY